MDAYSFSHPGYFLPPLEDPNLYDFHDGYGESYGLEQLYSEDYGIERRNSTSNVNSDNDSSSTSSSSSSSDDESKASAERTLGITGSFRQPSFLDAFRILYLKDGVKSKPTSQYLMTTKKENRIEEILERDGLGSKRLLFYPRPSQRGIKTSEVQSSTDLDKRVKVDGDFLRKYRNERVKKSEAPAAKLKPWELMLYKKLGFVQAV